MIFNRHGFLVEIPSPAVMGIINLTPDSFFAESRSLSADLVADRVKEFIDSGAAIVDIGACSTRPGSAPVGPALELERLSPVLEEVRARFPDLILSLDTFHASVAREAVTRWKVDIVNDVSGGSDPDMFQTVADLGVPYILTHSRGDSRTMQDLACYSDVTAEVISWLAFSLARLRELGIRDVIVDPGFGFAKTLDHNYQLMAELDQFKMLSAPLLVGISRKSMITSLLRCSADEALEGTIVLNTIAMMKGADIVRVHDVREAVVASTIVRRILDAAPSKT